MSFLVCDILARVRGLMIGSGLNSEFSGTTNLSPLWNDFKCLQSTLMRTMRAARNKIDVPIFDLPKL